MADKHGAHQTGEAWVVSLTEDFCKSPTVPVGYTIAQKLDQSVLTAGTVHALGTPVLNLNSRVQTVLGNEAGVGGGVVSGVNVGMCKPVADFAPKVRAEGQCVLRHDTTMEMNCAGPGGPGNVLGKIKYLSSDSNASTSMDTTGKKDEAYASGKRPAGPKKTSVKGPDGTEIPVYESDQISQNGYYSVDGDGPYIVVNGNLPSEASQQSTIVHEAGHARQDYDNSLYREVDKLGGKPTIGKKNYDGDIGNPLKGELNPREAQMESIRNNAELTEAEREKLLKEKQEALDILNGTKKTSLSEKGGILFLKVYCDQESEYYKYKSKKERSEVCDDNDELYKKLPPPKANEKDKGFETF